MTSIRKSRTKPVRAYWCVCKGGETNFGDVLTPYLIGRLTGRPVKRSTSRRGDVHMVTGSIISRARPNSIIWGCGIKRWADTLRFTPRRISAVRGPLTRAWLMEHGVVCPEVYGDPALLLPRLYQPQVDRRFKLGIIPHFVDYVRVRDAFAGQGDVRVVNVLDPVETVIDAIAGCECTASSSLHGLLTSHAYRIPSLWVKFSEKVSGDGSKFRDYFMSVNIPPYDALVWRCGHLDVDSRVDEVRSRHREIEIDLDQLLRVCPLKMPGR